MKILVLGASGGCGKRIVELGFLQGHKMNAIVRKTTKFSAPKEVKIIRGSVLDSDVLEQGLEDCDIVISALGIKRKNPLNPWSGLTSPKDLTTTVAELLVKLMPKYNINRYIGISAAGVRESSQAVHPIIRWMIENSNMNASYSDLAEMEKVFEDSQLDWMAVRPVTLSNRSSGSLVSQIDYYGLSKWISREALAEWILKKAEQSAPFTNRTPMLSSA